jgi:AcrR family transcriptional regulator
VSTDNVKGRQEFLDAALRCFERLGARRTTMVDVAEEAGVTRQTLYNYFPGGKDTLIGELIADEARRVNARARRRLDMDAPAPDLIAEAALQLVISARESHLVDVLIVRGALATTSPIIDTSPEVADVMAEYWEPVLARLEQHGDLRSGLDHPAIIRWLTFVHVALVARPDSFHGDPQNIRAAVRAHVAPLLTGAFH